MEIDGYQTVAVYVTSPPNQETVEFAASSKFRNNHVLETQYMTVYLKCKDESCCEPFKTDVEMFFPHRRIPPLIPIIRTSLGVEALHKCDVLDNQKLEFLSWEMRIVYQNKLVGNEDKKQFGLEIPYDLYFPSVQEKLKIDVVKSVKSTMHL